MVRAVSNPPNPWHSAHVELLGPAPSVELELFEEEAASILSRNDSPDLPFRWSLNPYRGCFHACAYCYARPTHQYLDWGAGTDFDRRIVVKTNAAALLREHLSRRSWRRESVMFSGVTDCYQPIEAHYALTRACLEACAEFRTPVGIVTKGALIERDVDLLREVRDRAGVRVYISIPFADDDAARRIEPYAATSGRRFRTMRRLAEAGIPVAVAVAPLIPGLNDHDVPSILRRARECGADAAFTVLLRLPAEVAPVFEERLREAFPLRADKVLRALTEMRQGRVNSQGFGARMRGQGARWDAAMQLFQLHCRKLGLRTEREALESSVATKPRQGRLFS